MFIKQIQKAKGNNVNQTQVAVVNNFNKLNFNNIKIKDLIDTLISHNELIAIWSKEDPWGEEDSQFHHYLLWKSEGHRIPEEFLNKEVDRIFGVIPEKITESDYINILIK